jgi:trans-2-enoyl-CoA reductase
MATLRPLTRPASRLLQQTHRPFLPLTPTRHKSGPYGYTQAKALVFSKHGEPSDVLHLHTHSISPSIPDTSVLLRALASPINPADVNTIQGTYGAKPTFTNLIGTAEPSAVAGNEGCFEVLSAGSRVSSLKKGDWVVPASTGFGAWRTHVLVEHAEKELIKVDREGLTPLQVATVSVNPCSAYRMLRDFVDLIQLSVESFRTGQGRGGAWFIQNGANSGVGRAAVQLGKLWGLRSINVIRARPTEEETRKLKEELKGLGATVVVTEEEFLERGFASKMKEEWTDGGREKVMLGLNCVGGANAGQLAKCLGEGGTMVTYGAMSKKPVMLPTGLLIFKDLRFRGFWLSRWANADREAKRRTIEEILGLVREGKFKDAPMQELRWDWDTEERVLREAVQGTLQGFRSGKGVFVFGDT